jgi:predicted N-acyltransferase
MNDLTRPHKPDLVLEQPLGSEPAFAVEQKSGRPGNHPSLTIPFPAGRARVVSLAELRHGAAWEKAFAEQCKDHRFYEIVEQTLDSKFEHHYLLLEDEAGRIRGVQPFFFVQQNLVEGIPGKLREAVEAIRRRFPRFLTMRVLMVGCAAGEGHLGACDSADEIWVADALFAILKTYARQAKASLVVFKDFPSTYRETLRNFRAHGYTRVPSMPMTELSLDYTDFDHYVSTLGSSTRKDLRRKFRKLEQAPSIELEVVNDISPNVDELYPLYLQVHERSQLKFERLTKAYLRALGQRMPECSRFFLWRQNGKAIAFSVCLVHNGTIYDDYLGLDYRVALDLHLYFYTFRDIIRWSLAQGLRHYRSSPLNYRPKLHFGCDLFPLDLYVSHTSSLLNPIFRRAVNFLEPTRHDPVLKRFRNAHALHG